MIAIDFSQIVTAEAKQQCEIEARRQAAQGAARAYLDSTDWYVTRFAETGQDIPQVVLDQRAEARAVFDA